MGASRTDRSRWFRYCVLLLPMAVLLACSPQQTISASDARQEAIDLSEERGYSPPDESFFLASARSQWPTLELRTDDELIDRGYFACHALETSEIATDAWFEHMSENDYDEDEVVAVLSAAIASLCPWHR